MAEQSPDIPEARQEPARPAPPTVPGALIAPKRPSAWPGVIGTIAIVLGSLATFGALSQVAAPLIMDWVTSIMPAEQRSQVEAMGKYGTEQIVLGLLGIAIAILLIVGGAKLLRRRRSAATILRIWAVLKVLNSTAGSVVGLLLQLEQFRALPQQGQAPAGMMDLMRSFAFVMLGISLLWLWAFPAFLLAWFARRKVRDEMKGWAA